MDWNKTSQLLDVIHKAAAAGPQYQWFADLANRELMKDKDIAAKAVAAEMKAAKDKADAEASKEAAETSVLQKAADARMRMAQVGQDKAQAEVDAKIIAEADRITKEREAKAAAKAVAPASPSTFVPTEFDRKVPPHG